MENTEDKIQTATFAGGCFWCIESDFDRYKGVQKVISGYTGGHKASPSYEEVVSGRTGHMEAVQVQYDPRIITYEQLLEIFWRNIDPTDAGGQFVDRGSQYRTAIFYHNQAQLASAEASQRALVHSGRFEKPIVTEIRPFQAFYPAEEHHQEYYKKNPLRYKFYRYHSGRDQFLKQAWQAGSRQRPCRDTDQREENEAEVDSERSGC